MTTTPEIAYEVDTPAPPLWRMSIERYQSMIKAGIITDDDHVELLEGIIVEKMTKNPHHIGVVGLLSDGISNLLPSGWFVNTEQPIEMANSMPEPDASVIRGKRRDYFGRYVTLKDIAMVIEVSDTTLKRDRIDKKRIYALTGVPIYWIVNLVDGQVEVFTNPYTEGAKSTYREQKIYDRNDSVPVIIDGIEVGRLVVAELLP